MQATYKIDAYPEYADGGGIAGESVTITNSTVSGNYTEGGKGSEGGGIAGGTVTLTDSTVSGNNSNNDNYDDLYVANTVTASFSLIGDNAGSGLSEAQSPDANGNLIGSANGGGIIDALLTPLGDYGGPTQTHALLTGSPAIDMGDPAITSGSDQRGFARVVDDPAVAPSIGAFGYQNAILVTIGLDTHVEGELNLREAIDLASVLEGPDTITFDTGITYISLTGQLVIYSDLTIDATLVGGLTIDAQQNSRIFYIASADSVTLVDLTLTGGKESDTGGAILSSAGNLNIDASSPESVGEFWFG